MALLKGVNLVEFYCLSASEIWNEKRVTFDWRDLIRGRVLYSKLIIYKTEHRILNITM